VAGGLFLSFHNIELPLAECFSSVVSLSDGSISLLSLSQSKYQFNPSVDLISQVPGGFDSK